MKNIVHSEGIAGYQSVPEFYAGKSVFITGGTGFLGKVILEKLLWSCKDIDSIFILIREKKGVNVEERIKQMINEPLFLRIRKERPKDLKKIVAIIGDITQPALGITPADEKKLIDKVSVIFHAAATIKFNEKLDLAIQTNVWGTKAVLDLCHRMDNIEAFVHVSTAYCHTGHEVLEEKVYLPPTDLDEVLKYIEQPCQDENFIKKHFLKNLPNTYTLTKGLAENYIVNHRGTIPTVIVRPSIVSPSLREPLEGWVDNWNGATGLVTATFKGANRVILGKSTNVLDLIPVDYVSNLAIVATATCSRSKELTIYNSCTSSCNPLPMKQLYIGTKKSAIEMDIQGFHPTLMFTNYKWLLNCLTLLLQTMPAHVADFCRRKIKRKPPQHVKLQSKIIAGRNLLNFFTSHSWEMKANNTKSLYASLSHSDKIEFHCDPSEINWDEYTKIYVEGIQKYLLPKSIKKF